MPRFDSTTSPPIEAPRTLVVDLLAGGVFRLIAEGRITASGDPRASRCGGDL